MPNIDESLRGKLYYEIMRRKFGRFLMWSAPDIRKTVGPFNTAPFDHFDKERSELVSKCQNWLSARSDEELPVLAERNNTDANDFVRDWHHLHQRKINELEKKEPPWYAGGFGHPDYLADFVYWSQSPYFSPHEALLLSVGIEPEHFSEHQLETFAERNTEGRARLWEPLQYLVRRHEQIRRQFPAYAYHAKISPKDLFAWFDLVDLDVHPEFTSKYLGEPKISTETGPADKRPDQREIDSICQLFTAMAIEHLGYDPSQKRSPITKEIVDLAASMGLQVSDDTVRKYLRHGATFISEDWKQGNH